MTVLAYLLCRIESFEVVQPIRKLSYLLDSPTIVLARHKPLLHFYFLHERGDVCERRTEVLQMGQSSP